MSDLEQDFTETAKQINDKIKEAAKAMAEANRLRQEAGLPSLIFSTFLREDIRYHHPKLSRDEISEKCDELQNKLDQIDVSPLEDELNEAGWSTSSSYC